MRFLSSFRTFETLSVEPQAPVFKTTTHGAGDAVLMNRAYVDEEGAVLGAAVIPVVKELGNPRKMGSQAPGA